MKSVGILRTNYVVFELLLLVDYEDLLNMYAKVYLLFSISPVGHKC